MSEYRPLITALKRHFKTPLRFLPKKTKQRINEDLILSALWDKLTPNQRRHAALNYDVENDPALEDDREFWFDFYVQIRELKEQIAELENVNTKTELGLELHHIKLPKLKEQLVILEREEKELLASKPDAANTSATVKPHPLTVFRSMSDLKFNEITFNVNELNLRVKARGKQASMPFIMLGLTMPNGVALNVQGAAFMALANNAFDPQGSGSEARMERLSKTLREAFNITDTPFVKRKPEFTVTIPKHIEDKYKGERRSTSYNDDINQSRFVEPPDNNVWDSLANTESDYESEDPTDQFWRQE